MPEGSRAARFLAPVRKFVGSLFAMLAGLNVWLAQKFKTTHKTILAVEISVLVGTGFAMMEIGEHLAAVVIWIILALLWISKIFEGDLEPGHRGLAIFEKGMHVVLALFVCSCLVAVTAIRRGNDPWSNLEWLWRRGPVHRHSLNSKERALFEKPLQGTQSPPMRIQISCPAADEKTCTYATQFQTYFGEAGWDVDGTVQRVTLIRPMQGVVLVEQGGTEESQTTKWKWNIGGWTKLTPTYEDVYQAFSNIGIEPDGSANYALPDNQITVYFGPEKENESEPTTLSGTIANLRRQRAAGLLPPPGEKPTPQMIEKARKQNK